MNKTNVDLAILIVNYKSADSVAVLVNELIVFLSNFVGWSIRIADNSGEIFSEKEQWSSVSIFDTGGNVGFGRACNFLAKNSCEKYLLFVNPDVKILNISFLNFLNIHKELKDILGSQKPLVLGGRLFDDAGNDQPSY